MNLKVKVDSKPKVGKAVFAITNINKGETVIESHTKSALDSRQSSFWRRGGRGGRGSRGRKKITLR